MDSLIEVARRPFVEMAPDLAGALVLLDAGAAEVAQLSLGPAFLFGLGAANVCELERCHPDDALFGQLLAATAAPAPPGAAAPPPQLHLVVVLTRLLTDSHPLVVRALMVHHAATRVTLCCALSELAHAQQAGTELGVEAYSEYSEALRQDLAQARAAAGLPLPREDQLRLTVRHLPLHLAALDGTTFVLPAAGAPAGMAIAGGRAAGFGPADRASDDADEGAMGVSGGLSLLAHALVDVARQIGARAEPFALGPVSAAIAREISTLPQPAPAGGALFGGGGGAGGAAAASGLSSPRFGSGGGAAGGGGGGGGFGAAAGSMALILIDRSLDLATPCCHPDHFLDAAAELLQRRPPAPPPPRVEAGAGRWAMFRPADMRIEAPGVAPWDCLGPSSAGAACAHPAPNAAGPVAAGEQQQHQEQAPGAELGGALPPLASAPPLGAPLFDPSDRRAGQLLDAAAGRRGRDALMGARKALKDALRAEKVAPSVRAKLSAGVAAAELEGLAAALAAAPGDAAMRQLPALFLGLAAAQVLSSPRWDAWGAMAPLERQLIGLIEDAASSGGGGGGGGAREAIVALFTDVLESVKAGRGLLTAADVLQLLVTLYCLSGDLTPPAPPLYSADEQALRRGLAAALAAAAAAMAGGGSGAGGAAAAAAAAACWEGLPAPLQAAIAEAVEEEAAAESGGDGGSWVLEERVEARLVEAFGRLRWAAAARGKLKDLRRLAAGVGAEGAPEVVPLVRQVLGKVLLQADIRDLQSQDGPSLGGILKAGLGRFGLGAAIGAIGAAAGAAAAGAAGAGPRPTRPHEFPAVMVFVVGGISAAEWRGVKQELEQHTFSRKPAVLLGGTALLSPSDAVRQLLA